MTARLTAEARRLASRGWRGPVYYDTLWREVRDALRGQRERARADELVDMAGGNVETLEAALTLLRASRRRAGVDGLAEALLVEAIRRARQRGW